MRFSFIENFYIKISVKIKFTLNQIQLRLLNIWKGIDTFKGKFLKLSQDCQSKKA